MTCATDTVVIKSLLIIHAVLVSSELVTNQLDLQKSSLLNIICPARFDHRVICEYELVLVGVCLTTFDNDSDIAVYGYCPYITASKIDKQISHYYHIEFDLSNLTEQTCGPLNRKGMLCSECLEGYGPAVYAFGNECLKCHGSVYGRWALYLFVVLFPITVFYIFVIIFNVHAASPPFTAFVLYCQIFVTIDRIQMPSPSRYTSKYHSPTLLLLARTLSGVWNLDFGRHIFPAFCVSESLNSYHALLLDYIIGFYPMLLILITYILIQLHAHDYKVVVAVWKPFHRCFAKVRRSWDPQASIMNTFATFLFLSFSKILFISQYSITSTFITILNSTVQSKTHDRLYYDPRIQMYSHQHIPFVVLSYTLTIAFVYIPIILLCCYPTKCFKKILSRCCGRKKVVIDMFMDTFQGYYKDGTSETYDWRSLSGLYPLLMVATLPALSKKISEDHSHDAIVILIVTGVFALVRPYKKLLHNIVEILLLLVTSYIVSYLTKTIRIRRANYIEDDVDHATVIFIIFVLPHLILVLVIAFRALQLLEDRFDLTNKCRLKQRLPWLDRVWRKINNLITGRNEESEGHPFLSYGTF